MRLDQKYKSLLNSYHVNTPLRIAHFMAQIEHESGGFKYLRELGSDKYLELNIWGLLKKALGRAKEVKTSVTDLIEK